MRRVLVTGASSGIGAALVEASAARGDDVLATGQRAAEDAKMPDGVRYLAANLAGPHAIDTISNAWGDGPLDLLIANAGTGHARPIEAEDAASIADVVAVNLGAPIRLAHAFAERLFAVGGTLVLIGSVAHTGAPGMPAYAATKAGLDAFARALDAEWRGRASVHVVHPGPTRTAMLERSGYRHARLSNETLRRAFLSPAAVAAAVLRQAERSGSSGWRHKASYGAVGLDRLRGALRLP